jgi:formamidopyrimidine-DNA glycosylase
MPELPEVITIKKQLEKAIVGKTITSASIFNEKLRYQVNFTATTLQNKQIYKLSNLGKCLIIHLDDVNLLFHMGMSGNLLFRENSKEQLHDHISISVEGCPNTLFFNDPRRIGYCLVVDDAMLKHMFHHYGIDPISPDFSASYLHKFCNTKLPIKALLMENRVVLGIGNIYASESLFHSHILPYRPAASLSEEELRLLCIKIKEVLSTAIQRGGTSVRTYLHPDGTKGKFGELLCVYGRKYCLQCLGKVESIIIKGRNSFFCPAEQF